MNEFECDSFKSVTTVVTLNKRKFDQIDGSESNPSLMNKLGVWKD